MTTRITETGFNAGQFGQEGDLAALDRRIGEQAAMGATVCELSATMLDAVSARRLLPARVAAVQAVLARHALRYTLHAPIAVNLMDLAHADLQREAAEASLALAAACGADIVVFHPGRVPPAVWVDRERELLAREAETLSALGDRAATLGLRIAYENMSPNRRIIAGTETSYALDLDALAAQIAAVGHPSVVACLDVSHARQGAVLRGFDMVEAAGRLAPHVGHIHFSDSTGLPSTIQWDTEGERLFFGIGDMHAPPGHGEIDFPRLADRLAVQEGTAIVIELKANHYAQSGPEVLTATRDFARRINGLNA